MRQTEMVPGHFKNGGDIPSKFVHEKETICYKYEPGRVFRAGFEFLKRQFSEIGMEKRFMRMSWLSATAPFSFYNQILIKGGSQIETEKQTADPCPGRKETPP